MTKEITIQIIYMLLYTEKHFLINGFTYGEHSTSLFSISLFEAPSFWYFGMIWSATIRPNSWKFSVYSMEDISAQRNDPTP